MDIRATASSVLRFLLARQKTVLIATAGVTLCTALSATRLTTNNKYETWLPAREPVAELLRETNQEFAANSLVFVCLDFGQRGVFDEASLREIRRLTERLEELPELFFVLSLANFVDIRASEKTIFVETFLQDFPQGPEETEHIRSAALSNERLAGTLVSRNGRYATILLNVDGRYDEVRVAGQVERLLAEEARNLPHFVGGYPALAHAMDGSMERDLRVLLPFMVVAMAAILALGLRSLTGVVLPLSVCLLSIVWTLGTQAAFAVPMNLLTPAVLVLLFALGSDYAVHAVNHWQRNPSVVSAGTEIGLPIVMSTLTTVSGLLTFGATKILLLRNFGFELAFGLFVACILTLTSLLCSLAAIEKFKRRAVPHRSCSRTPPPSWILHNITRVSLRRPGMVLMTVLILLAFAAVGIRRIHTNVDYVTFLPEGSKARKGHEIFKEEFGGVYPLALCFEGDLEEPSLLQHQLRMEHFLRSNPQLSGFTSMASLLAEANRLVTGVYAIPESRASVAELWLLLEGQPFLKTLVNERRQKGLVNALIRDSDTATMTGLARFISAALPHGSRDEMLVVEVARLPAEARKIVASVRLRAAAEELAWLAAGYDRSGPCDPASLLKALEASWPEAASAPPDAALWENLARYLREDTPAEMSERAVAAVVAAFQKRFSQDPSGAWLPEVEEMLAQEQALPQEDAVLACEGALAFCQEQLRMARAQMLADSVRQFLPARAAENPLFEKRAQGVLWSLLGDRPALSRSALPESHEIERAVLQRIPFRLQQTGAPAIFETFEELLIRSQVQSLLLAVSAVLAIVSLLQRSFKKGVVLVIPVLIPLVIMIGIMGWAGIPLDFGTVLFGALIMGLGIDGCIHVLYFEAKMRHEGAPAEKAVAHTLGHVGRAVLTANTTTATGFLMLVFSSSQALRNFGLVNALAISLVTLSILLVLPPLIQASRVLENEKAPKAEKTVDSSAPLRL